MKKRTIKFVVLAVLIAVCLCASTLLAACDDKDSYYLSGSFNNWAKYGRGDSIQKATDGANSAFSFGNWSGKRCSTA